jgi:hypothetical protein
MSTVGHGPVLTQGICLHILPFLFYLIVFYQLHFLPSVNTFRLAQDPTQLPVQLTSNVLS